MENKLAKLKYLPNNFEILENGDHVICAISGKKISLENLKHKECSLPPLPITPIFMIYFIDYLCLKN